MKLYCLSKIVEVRPDKPDQSTDWFRNILYLGTDLSEAQRILPWVAAAMSRPKGRVELYFALPTTIAQDLLEFYVNRYNGDTYYTITTFDMKEITNG